MKVDVVFYYPVIFLPHQQMFFLSDKGKDATTTIWRTRERRVEVIKYTRTHELYDH